MDASQGKKSIQMGIGKSRRSTGLGKGTRKAQEPERRTVDVGIIGADAPEAGSSTSNKTMGEGTEIGGGMATQGEVNGDGLGVSTISGLSEHSTTTTTRPTATIMTDMEAMDLTESGEGEMSGEEKEKEKPSKRRRTTQTAAAKKAEKEEQFQKKLESILETLGRNVIAAASFSRLYCKLKEAKDDDGSVQPLMLFDNVKSDINKIKTQLKQIVKKRPIPVAIADRIGELFKEFRDAKIKVKSFSYMKEFGAK